MWKDTFLFLYSTLNTFIKLFYSRKAFKHQKYWHLVTLFVFFSMHFYARKNAMYFGMQRHIMRLFCLGYDIRQGKLILYINKWYLNYYTVCHKAHGHISTMYSVDVTGLLLYTEYNNSFLYIAYKHSRSTDLLLLRPNGILLG